MSLNFDGDECCLKSNDELDMKEESHAIYSEEKYHEPDACVDQGNDVMEYQRTPGQVMLEEEDSEAFSIPGLSSECSSPKNSRKKSPPEFNNDIFELQPTYNKKYNSQINEQQSSKPQKQYHQKNGNKTAQYQNDTYENSDLINFPIKMPSDRFNFSGRNTSGKQYDEYFKRQFTRDFLRTVKGRDLNTISRMIQLEAERIRVYASEVSCWLAIYKIVFIVEEQIKQRSYMPEDVNIRIEENLIEYLNQNIFEKKYKFIKVSSGVFRALKVKKCTGDFWLKSLIRKYRHRLDPRIDLIKLISPKTDERKINESDCQLGDFLPLYAQSQNPQPIEYKIQTVKQLDAQIERKIKQIFKQKQAAAKINIKQLKVWYTSHGKFNLFQPRNQY